MYPRNDHRGHRTRMALCLALLLGIAAAAAACGARQPTPVPDVDEAFLPEAVVSATGRVVPVTWAELALATPGMVHEILISEGDRVDAGQVLARLDAAELEAGVAQAEAALTTARAQLAQLEAGARAVDIAVAEAAVRTAQNAADAVQVAVEVAQANAAAAEAAVAAAQSSLRRLRTGPTEDELEVARQQVEQAKAQRYAAQGQRDALGGLRDRAPETYQPGSYESAEGQVFTAESAVAIARALANDPRLILADEPTGNLDSVSGQEVIELLCALNRDQATTVILVTHDSRVARATGRILNMMDGKIVREHVVQAPLTEDLRALAQSDLGARLIARDYAALQGLPLVRDGRLTTTAEALAEVLSDLRA